MVVLHLLWWCYNYTFEPYVLINDIIIDQGGFEIKAALMHQAKHVLGQLMKQKVINEV